MTQDTDATNETTPTEDPTQHTFGVTDPRIVLTGDAAPAVAVPPATREQIRHVADAVIAEATRKLGKSLKAGDVELFARVTQNAVKLQLNAAAGDAAQARAHARRRKQLDHQLAEVRAFASDGARSMFWGVVNVVVDRLGKFVIGAILPV